MTEAESQFPTTYKYSPLPSKRHIRLLQIADCEISDSNATTKYSLVDYEIPPDDTELNFEAISVKFDHLNLFGILPKVLREPSIRGVNPIASPVSS